MYQYRIQYLTRHPPARVDRRHRSQKPCTCSPPLVFSPWGASSPPRYRVRSNKINARGTEDTKPPNPLETAPDASDVDTDRTDTTNTWMIYYTYDDAKLAMNARVSRRSPFVPRAARFTSRAARSSRFLFLLAHALVRAPFAPARGGHDVHPAFVHRGYPPVKRRLILLVPLARLALDPPARTNQSINQSFVRSRIARAVRNDAHDAHLFSHALTRPSNATTSR